MTPAFWLCLLLVITSGLSAYIGNEWGRKLGKRKLSIFRMRPKHSSTFVTVLLSMCLSLGLMGFLFTLMPGLQTAFFVPANRAAEQEAFTHYEDALQLANARLQRLSQAERSERLAPEPPNNQSSHSRVSPAVPEAPPSSLTQVAPLRETPPLASVTTPKQPPRQQVTAPRPKREFISPSPIQRRRSQTPPVAVAARPERPGQSRIEGPRRAKRQAASSVLTATPSQANPLQADLTPPRIAARPGYPTGALFELTVNGELNATESAQLQQGIERLTQDYLSLLGIQEEALQFKSAQIQNEMLKLSASGQYRLQIALSPSQTADIPVDVSVSMLQASAPIMPEGETFDPQLLLEEQRLQSNSTRQSLQQDLQAVLQKHAKQQQMALKLTPQPTRRSRSAQLPFEILNVVNQNGVIRGELFLR